MHSKEVVCLARKKRDDGLSIRRIAMDLKLSKSTVEYMLKTNSERKKKRGRKRSIGKRTERRMKRPVTRLLTSGEKVTARKVKEKCELDVNVRTVQRTLHRIGLKYAKAKKKITLTKKHKWARLECAKRWLTKHVDFKMVIFTDLFYSKTIAASMCQNSWKNEWLKWIWLLWNGQQEAKI